MARSDLESQQICRAAEQVFGETGVFLAYAHGSRIHGTPATGSDLDVGYYVDSGGTLSIQEEMVLEVRLSDLLAVEVDLRNLREAPLEMRGRVLERGIRIYCSDDVARVNLERDLLSSYHDYKEEYAVMHRMRLDAIAAKGLA
jgi:predicted nucleotidyltransferase